VSTVAALVPGAMTEHVAVSVVEVALFAHV
jgi:hypothetical protein